MGGNREIGLPPAVLKEKLGIELTEEQKTAIINLWNSQTNPPPTLQQLIDAAYPGENVDPRSPKGKLVRSFLSNRKLKPRLANDYVKKERIEFNQEQKERIVKLAPTMRPYEIARVIFNNPTLEPAKVETKSIIEYLDSLPAALKTQLNITGEDDTEEEYLPPRSIPGVIPKINKYANPTEDIDNEKLNPKQKKEINALLGYLHATRFLYQINSYKKQSDRILFESSFIKYTYDKGDLTQEEVDQYIMAAIEVVNSHKIEQTIRMFEQEQDALMKNGERLSMTLVEAINYARKEFNDSGARQMKLFAALTQKRSERLSGQLRENASILNLITLWKDEENRKEMIRYQMLKKKALSDEIKNYMTWGEQKLKILGISENEILEG